jgi:LPXTG-site transpeptidase (sortase) family protein
MPSQPKKTGSRSKSEILLSRIKPGFSARKFRRSPDIPIFSLTGIGGMLLVILGIGYLLLKQLSVSFLGNPYYAASLSDINGKPITISIPTIHLQQKITESGIIQGVWQTSDTNATHLNVSANPGQNGNIIIYGHNTYSIFGNLPQSHIGDPVILSADNSDHPFRYIIKQIRTVLPTDLSVISPTSTEVLTIYTCTGWFDSQRFVITAYPVLTNTLTH